MAIVLDWLTRYAGVILSTVAGLLTVGALLSVMRLPLIGWALYSIGFVGLLVALPAIAAAYRSLLTPASWIFFALAWLGVVIGLPALVVVWDHYVQSALPDAVLARAVAPVGVLAAASWLGIGLVALTLFDARAVPRGGALVLVVGSVLALASELFLLGPFAWALGILIASVGLVWLVPEAEMRPSAARQRPESAHDRP